MDNVGYIKCLSKKDLLEYLKNSEYGTVYEILRRLDIDGQKFLEINELELVKLGLSTKQRTAIMSCISKVKDRRPTIPKKPAVIPKNFAESKVKPESQENDKKNEYIDMAQGREQNLHRKNKLLTLDILNQSDYSEIEDLASPVSPPDEYVDMELPHRPNIMWHSKPLPKQEILQSDDSDLYEPLKEEEYEEPVKLVHVEKSSKVDHEETRPDSAPSLPPRKSEKTLPILPSVPYDNHKLPTPPKPIGNERTSSMPTADNVVNNEASNTDVLPRPPRTLNVDTRHVELIKSMRNEVEQRFSTRNNSSSKVVKYFRNVDRQGAQELLKRIPNLQDGAFVIRKSKKHFWVITIWHAKRFFNVTVDRLENGFLYVTAEKGAISDAFETLDELVEYHQKHALVIKKHDQQLNIYLRELLTDDIV